MTLGLTLYTSPVKYLSKFLPATILFTHLFLISEVVANENMDTLIGELLPTVEEVLQQNTVCNSTIVIRSQSLSKAQLAEACKLLIAQEDKFHRTFNTRGKPVADDNNVNMRANIYRSRDEFVNYAGAHFNMPTDNGGMYLEGYPDRADNQAEFVAYQRAGKIWNLSHEYIHYLDGRFNKYGDYCNGLHDDHAGPEFCPSPNLPYPHIVWWAEGLGEYLAWGGNNPQANAMAKDANFKLSEIFNTSSNENTGADRVYRWGYLAVRFMMENHRQQVEGLLSHLRAGNWQNYQATIKSWGSGYDDEFSQWLIAIATAETAK